MLCPCLHGFHRMVQKQTPSFTHINCLSVHLTVESSHFCIYLFNQGMIRSLEIYLCDIQSFIILCVVDVTLFK